MAYNAIGAIIAIEKKAQEIIAPATKAQESLADDICSEKKKIYSAKKAEYEQKIADFKKGEEDKAQRLIKKADEGAEEAKKKLDEMYDQNFSKWLDTLFKNVSGQV
ncbi:MAG: hypothetical protein SPF92_06245 [Clostridia bacterium]|nr:hypothetical protein [Clostridia bacterium]